jgi:predicted ATPase
MATIILFSGGCNSGKTTTLKAVASKLQKRGYAVTILDELIRKETDKPIDELRKNAKEYLQLQNKIIREKIKQEKSAIEDNRTETVYLADRAVTDSLFYLENYVDKSQLDEEGIKLFCRLHSSVHEYLKRYFWRYSLIVEFQPVAVRELDLFRPVHIDMMKNYECICIARLNYCYSNGYRHQNFTVADLNYMKLEEAVDKIIEKAGL